MIKHNHCGLEFENRLQARFVAFTCQTTIEHDYQNDSIYVKMPFVASQLYQHPEDLIKNKACAAQIYCPECDEWYSINEFEFFAKCLLCNKKNIKIAKVYCRQLPTQTLIACWSCIKKHCVDICGNKRGLCETYRKVLYKLENLQRRGRE